MSREGDRVSALAYAPAGKTIASGGDYGTVSLWDLATCRELRRLGELPRQVGAVGFTPDGKVLVAGAHDGTLTLWDVATGREKRTLQAPSGFFAFYFVDNKTLLAACADEMYRAWDLASGTELTHDPTHLGPVKAFAFAPDGHWVVSGSWESTVRQCDLATGQDMQQIQGHRSSLQALAVSPDGRMVASGSLDETLRVWEVLTGKERIHLKGLKEGVFALAFAPDGRTIASASNDTTILVWDTTDAPPMKGPAKAPVRLAPTQLEQLWQDLASSDAGVVYRAMWASARSASQTLPFLNNKLKLVVPADRQRVQMLLADLNNDEVTRRDKAVQELEKIGALCTPALEAALQASPSLDVRRRLERLREKARGVSPDTLLAFRVAELLELANTAEARRQLEALAREEPPTRATREARAALERLARRPVQAG